MKVKTKILLAIIAPLLFLALLFPVAAKADAPDFGNINIQILKRTATGEEPAINNQDYQYQFDGSVARLNLYDNSDVEEFILTCDSEKTHKIEYPFYIYLPFDFTKLTLRDFKLSCPRDKYSLFYIETNQGTFTLNIEGNCDLGFYTPSGEGDPRTESINCIDYFSSFGGKGDRYLSITSPETGGKLKFSIDNIVTDATVGAITTLGSRAPFDALSLSENPPEEGPVPTPVPADLRLTGNVCFSGKGKLYASKDMIISDSASIYDGTTYPDLKIESDGSVVLETSGDIFIAAANDYAINQKSWNGKVYITDLEGALYLSGANKAVKLYGSCIDYFEGGGKSDSIKASDEYAADFGEVTKEALLGARDDISVENSAGEEVAAKTICWHNHNYVAQEGQDPTYDASGFKPYYECKYCKIDAEDSEGTTAIDDIAAWKAKGGDGYIDKLKYVVTFDTDGGSAVDAQNVYKGDNAEKPEDPTKDGKEFADWITGEGDIFDFATPIESDITIYAKWENPLERYTVSYDSKGGTAVDAQTVDKGAKAAKPQDPTKDGKVFAGWITNKDEVFDFETPITSDITLYAKWDDPLKKYTVTFDSKGGSKVDSQTVNAGESATKPQAPVKEGYTFIDWTTDKGEVYNFNNPVVADITLFAKWEDENPVFFVDVKKTDYFYDAVKWAVKGKIASGTDSTHFSPYSAATRAHVVTFIWRAAGAPEPKGDTSKFTDVNKYAYYAKAIAWASEQEITAGTSETTFSPNAACTRAQTITLLANYAGVKKAKVETGFSDVKSTAYYAAAVKWAKDNEITVGTTATTFSPDAVCTRAQALSFVYRYFVKSAN